MQGVPDLNTRIKQARQDILRFFNTNEEKHSVIFTSGATQSLKLVGENFTFNDENGLFLYLDECHTSVVGLREIAPSYKVANSENVLEILSESQSGLFTFPAMSNFNGEKFPLKAWIDKAHENNFKVLLDTASYVSTNFLDLTDINVNAVLELHTKHKTFFELDLKV